MRGPRIVIEVVPGLSDDVVARAIVSMLEERILISVSEVVETLGISKTQARRVIKRLCEEGVLKPVGRFYKLRKPNGYKV